MPEPKGFLIVPVGFRADGTLRALELTDDDYLKVAFPDPAEGLVGVHGWLASAWQKNPLAFGYSDRIAHKFDLSIPSTNNHTISDTAVQDGEIWVITHIAFEYTGTPPTEVQIQLYDGTDSWHLFNELTPTSGKWYDRQGWWAMKKDDLLRAIVTGATQNDYFRGRVLGFRVDIDQ